MSGPAPDSRAPTLEERVTTLEDVVASLVVRHRSEPPAPPDAPRLAIELEPGGHRLRSTIPKDRAQAHQLLALLREAVEEVHGPSGRILTPA